MFRRHRTTGDAAAKQPTGTPATTLLVPGAAITLAAIRDLLFADLDLWR
jgi:hypothetical protein